YAELLEKYGKIEAAEFLKRLVQVVPYKIHTLLTDNGIPFTNRRDQQWALTPIFSDLPARRH
ncbi:MAG: IS481 family transposase, partial [Myxococcaceae bacterium]|nr:IS481 family transposase [Myxococcaceae bacterium]